MTITLNLDTVPFVPIEHNRITLPQNVSVQANKPVQGLKLFVRNKNEQRTYSLDTPADITDMLVSGDIEMGVVQYDGFDIVCRWQVETLIVKEAEFSSYAIPAIEALRTELNTVRNAVIELNNIIKGE